MPLKPDEEPFLTYRKVQIVGKSSIAITIPKKWVEELKLRPGSHVLLRRAGNSIIIVPASTMTEDSEAASRRAEITVKGDELWRGLRRLVSYYLAGYREVTVRLDEGVSSLRAIIKEFVRNKLPGTEIIYENDRVVSIRFIVEEEHIAFKHLLGRMCENVLTILKSATVELSSSRSSPGARITTAAADDEVDRLYLLTLRQANIALIDESIRARMGIKMLRELLAVVSVAKSLERCGDHATRVSYLCQNLLALLTDRKIEVSSLGRLAELSNLTCTLLKDSVYSFNTGDVELAQDILDKRRVELRKLSIKLINDIVREASPVNVPHISDLTTYLVLILESIRRILAYSYDIAEITIDTYSVR